MPALSQVLPPNNLLQTFGFQSSLDFRIVNRVVNLLLRCIDSFNFSIICDDVLLFILEMKH